MNAGTSEWQRVDNTGCVSATITLLLLGWVVIVPYSLVFHNVGWLIWSVSCVAVGIGLVVRQRRSRGHALPGVSVEVMPVSVRVGETIAVKLRLSGEVATRVRWWKSALVARVVDEHDSRRDETASASEFVVDPEADEAPVSELEMVLAVPGVRDVEEWWVQVTVETGRGRMESGRVAVRVH